MERIRHCQNGFGRCLAIVSRERDVAFEAKERPNAFGIRGAAFFLLSP
jgi:hypothetical protein